MNRANNFNLIRLLAALQVVAHHLTAHFHISYIGLADVFIKGINCFPGVPVFFAISGYLIPVSWERAPEWKPYAIKRFLRLYPGLWTALLVSVFTMIALKGLTIKAIVSKSFLLWLVAQIVSVQLPVPGSLKHYGVGNPNRSLWTIFVELGFYAVVPILFIAGKSLSRIAFNWMLGLLAIGSFLMNYVVLAHGETGIYKLLQASFAPHIWLFLLGWILARNQPVVERFLKDKALLWLIGYLAFTFVAHLAHMEIVNLALQALLAPVTISMAFTFPELTKKLLGDVDISYGVYLYHMIVINALIAMGIVGVGMPVILVFGSTLGLASLSWFLVEKRALLLKPGTKKAAQVI